MSYFSLKNIFCTLCYVQFLVCIYFSHSYASEPLLRKYKMHPKHSHCAVQCGLLAAK